MASLRSQELALGLQSTPHVKDPDRVPDPLVQRFERTGEPPLLDYARAVARPVFQKAGSWSEVHERLAEQGLYLERKGQGLVVTDDHQQIKASSIDRAASLRSLEARLGPYEERRPLLQEVGRDLRAEHREHQLAEQLTPLHQACQEVSFATVALDEAVRRSEQAPRLPLGSQDGVGAAIHSAAESAYRNPAEATGRYMDRLREGGPPEIQPVELGRLKGPVLRAGRTYIPLGSEATRAYQVAVEKMLQTGCCLSAGERRPRPSGGPSCGGSRAAGAARSQPPAAD